MHTRVHFRWLYVSTCAVSFDTLHPVKQLPRDATGYIQWGRQRGSFPPNSLTSIKL